MYVCIVIQQVLIYLLLNGNIAVSSTVLV